MTKIWSKASAHLVLCAGIIVFAGGTLVKHLPDDSLSIEVELTVGSGGSSQVFVNLESVAQQQATGVSPGPQTLIYRGIDGPVHSIRVDPLLLQGQRVTIKQISVLDPDGQPLAAFSGRDFSTWNVADAVDVVVDDNGMTLTTATPGAYVSSSVAVPSSDRLPAFVSSLRRWLHDQWLTTGVVLGLPILILGIGLLRRRPWDVLPVLLGVLAVRVGMRLAGRGQGVTPADRAFGHSGWFGNDAAYPQRFLMITGGLVVGLCLVALAASRQLPLPASWRASPRIEPLDREIDDTQVESEGDDPGEPTATVARDETPVDAAPITNARPSWPQRLFRSRWPAVLCVPLVYALIRMPSAHDVTAGFTAPLSQGFDQANIRTWDHFFATGLRPMVDFWYPYGNLIYLRAGVVGAVINWMGETLCLVALGLALWRLSRRALPVVWGTAAFALLGLEFYQGTFRYWLPLMLIAWFATVRRTDGMEARLALAAVALTPFVSLDAGVYTFAGVLGVIAIDELSVRGLGGASARRRLIREGIALGSGWVAYLLVGAVRGGLQPTLSLVFDQRSTSAYVGVISTVGATIKVFPRLVLYVFPFAAIAVGLYAALRRRGRVLDLSGVPALAGIGIYSVLILGKNLIRPGLDIILAANCIALIALAIAATWNMTRPPLPQLALGAFAGVLLLQLQTGHNLPTWRSQIADAPEHAAGLLGALTWDRHETVLFRPTLQPSQMDAAFPEEVAAADAMSKLAPGGRIFVLGDSQYLYPLTGTKPYWMISIYDMSPVREQRHVLSELEKSPPQVVAFDRRDTSFDGVPNVLRTPLVYRWVIDHYSLSSSIGPYDLLRPRDATEIIDWDYWTQVFGPHLELSRLPADATASGASCEVDRSVTSEPCIAYLSLDVEPIDEAVSRSLTVTGSSGTFAVTFRQIPGDRTLRIPLGRLWFWTEDSFVTVDSPGWVSRSKLFGIRDTVLY